MSECLTAECSGAYGEDVTDAMIRASLARSYDGGKKQGWMVLKPR